MPMLIERLDLVVDRIRPIENQRDAAVAAASETAPEAMTKGLAELQGDGVQTAAILVHESSVRSASARVLCRIGRRVICQQ